MTRYFFNLHDGVAFFADVEGRELDDQQGICRHALEYLAETVSDVLPRSPSECRIVVSVSDVEGTSLLSASITLEVRYLVPKQLN